MTKWLQNGSLVFCLDIDNRTQHSLIMVWSFCFGPTTCSKMKTGSQPGKKKQRKWEPQNCHPIICVFIKTSPFSFRMTRKLSQHLLTHPTTGGINEISSIHPYQSSISTSSVFIKARPCECVIPSLPGSCPSIKHTHCPTWLLSNSIHMLDPTQQCFYFHHEINLWIFPYVCAFFIQQLIDKISSLSNLLDSGYPLSLHPHHLHPISTKSFYQL